MTSVDPELRLHCDQCGARLAADQTYCVVCGARARPLPARVAVAISDIEDHGHAIAADDPMLSEGDEDDEDDEEPEDVVSAARAGIVAVLAMLAVGVLIGGLTSSGGLAGLANTIVLAFRPGVQPAAQVVATRTGAGGGGFHAGGGGGGGGGGRHATPPAPPAPPAQITTVTPPPPVTVTLSESQATTPRNTATTPPAPQLPPIGHVWLIVLSQQRYAQAWADSSGHPYLGKLQQQGELIVNYDSVASSPLANEIAMLSGQGPTNATLADCPTYRAVTPGKTGQDKQVQGDGCIYPDSTDSLPEQFIADGLTWKAYIQGIGASAGPPCSTGSSPPSSSSPSTSTAPVAGSCLATTTGSSSSTTSSSSTSGNAPADTIGQATCPHPALNAPSLNQDVTASSTYVNWKNPVIYFQSILDPGGSCDTDDVGIGQLAKDLKNPGATPTFSYIAPDPCNDGSDTPCRPGANAGLGQAQPLLKQIVGEIEHSASYKQNGLILITFDEAPQSGPNWDTSSCCGEPVFPNVSTSSSASDPGSVSPSSSSSTSSTSASPTVTETQTMTTTTTAGCNAATSGSSSSSSNPSVSTTPTPGTTSAPTTSTVSATCTPVFAGNPPGGGQVGLLMISPYVAPGKLDVEDTLNHFSLLKSIENLFKLPNIGYADDSALQAMGAQMFETTRR